MSVQIPLRDFFKNPSTTSYQISPDGKHISYAAPYKNRLNIFVVPTGELSKIGTEAATQVTFVEDRDISGYIWGSNDHILYVRDFGGDENFHIYSSKIDGTYSLDLTPFENVRAQIIDDLPDDDEHIIIGLNRRVAEIFDPYRLSIETGEISMIAENPGNITSWQTDHNGKLRIAIATDGVNETILYRDSESEAFSNIITTNFKETLQPLFFTFDNKNVFAASNLGRDKTAIIEYDIVNDKEIRELFSHPEVDVTNLNYSRKKKALTSFSYATWKREYHFISEERAELQKRFQQQIDGEAIIVGYNKNEDLLIVRSFSDRSLGAYYLYDVQADELQMINEVSPWLPAEELAEMKPIQYKSRDGLTINGYLTLPKGVAPQNLPVVINPHGGPWVRDNWGFNPEVQFLANRGYAVLQMNYRGSTGYGKAFWQASFKQWGLKMQDDISDGVHWLINEGIANKNRIAIYGGSYGGYATLAGITLTPDLYTCAVDYVGVSNLFTFMNTIPPYWKPYLEMLFEMVGNPNEKDQAERMRATSPVFHVERIKVPLLIAQGAKDPRVVQAESDQMVAALQAKGIAVEYILKENEGHGFRNEENRFEFYEAMERFLKEHL